MIFFTIKVNCGGKEISIGSGSEFSPCYNDVFSESFLRDLYVDGCLDIHVSRNGVRIGEKLARYGCRILMLKMAIRYLLRQ
jgi:hypothetical protein